MSDPRRIDTIEDAAALLAELRAPERLVRHGRLVLEAADELLADLRVRGVTLDERLVRAGAEAVSVRLGVEVWSIFVELDTCFERIADDGPERLRRSQGT